MEKHKIVENFLKQTIVIDTESTGIEPKEAEICEIGIAFSSDGKTCSSGGMLFGTKEPIPFAASSKNNISRTMLKSLPTIADLFEEAADILCLGDTSIRYTAAHNYEYDMKILHSNFAAMSKQGIADGFLERRWICTYRLAQHLFKPTGEHKDISYSLNFLRYYFELPCDHLTVHRAGDDSEVCWHLLKYIANYVVDNVIPESELTDDFDLGKFLYHLTKEPIEYLTMPFGKHKGELLTDVPMSYYNWLLKNSDMINDQSPGYDPDFAASVEKELNRRLGNS